MPRYVATQMEHLAPRQLTFMAPEAMRVAPTVTRLSDGALILNAVPLIADQDLLYYGYELPLSELFGLDGDAEYEAFDQEFIGRLTLSCAEMMLDQFEGLALTDTHVFVEAGKRDEVAVGTFLTDATLIDNQVHTRALIYSSPAIVKIDANGSELSIGGMAYMEVNSKRAQTGEPDFFIQRINLNHVALVERGRAGPEARLLNHRATLAQDKKEIPHMKVTINGVEIEVPDVAVNHFSAQISTLETQVSTLTASTTELANSVSAVTAERDTAQGAVAAAQAELATSQAKVVTLENSAPDVSVEATRIANEHATFADEAQRLGHTESLALGAYDRAAVMLTVLNARGAKFEATANADMLNGAWAFALTHTTAAPRSVLDNPTQLQNQQITSISAGATAAVNSSYFGGGKKKEA